jgi:enterochelin esterase family protein
VKVVLLDGPDYRRRAGWRGRAVSVASHDRDEDFSCSPRWARAFVADVDALGAPLLGVGSSLGALALLHAHWTYPGRFAGLLLQSGSFFHEDTERYERGFRRFDRVSRFVDRILKGRGRPARIPLTMTCGLAEQNLACNRAVAEALAAHRWELRFVEHPGGHEWPWWGRLVREELPRLRRRAAG